jgi:hypothetical protein
MVSLKQTRTDLAPTHIARGKKGGNRNKQPEVSERKFYVL